MRDVNPCDRVLAETLEHPWALTDEKRAIIATVLARRIVGQGTSDGDLQAAIAKRKVASPAPPGESVIVIPVYGVIAPHMDVLTEMSGGTSFNALTNALAEAVAANPKAIIFDIDSPGGSVAGATEFARAVREAKTKVPIVAQANHLMASAAFWVGSQATQIVATPSSLVGAVGVYTMYDDISKALELLGVKREVIAAGKFKGEGVDGGPLTDSARAHRQGVVDHFYSLFLNDVHLGRGVTVEVVRAKYGQGRVLTAEDAMGAGMVDRIATLSETVARFFTPAAGSDPARLSSATPQEPQLAATGQERAALIAQHLEFVRLGLEADSLL